MIYNIYFFEDYSPLDKLILLVDFWRYCVCLLVFKWKMKASTYIIYAK